MLRDEFGRLQRLTRSLRAEEVFLRDRTVRLFGSKAGRDILERVALRTVKPKHPALKVLDLALDAYDLYTWFKPAEITPIPRDPSNPDDMALSFPEGAWESSYSTFDPTTVRLPDPAHWYQGDQNTSSWPPGCPDYQTWTGSLYGDIAAGKQGLRIREVNPADLVEGSFPITDAVTSYGRFDINGEPWTYPVESHWPKVGDPPVEWLNPQRVNTVPAQEGAWPIAQVRPAPRFADMPSQERHPWSEEDEPASNPDIPARPWVPEPIIFPDPSVEPGRDPQPGEQPGANPDPAVDPGRVPDVDVATDPERREPPPEREYERKVRIRRRGLAVAVYSVTGMATEALDAVDAVWDTLPDSCKFGRKLVNTRDGRKYITVNRPTPDQKVADIWRCRDHLDAEKVLSALVKQNIEDAAWALPGQLDKEAAQAGGLDRGLAFGPWDSAMQNVIQELRHKAMLEKKAARHARALERKAHRQQMLASRQLRHDQRLARKIERKRVKKQNRAARRLARAQALASARHARASAHQVKRQKRIVL